MPTIREFSTPTDIASDHVELLLTDADRIRLPWSPKPANPRREIVAGSNDAIERSMKAEARAILLRQIALGRRWLDQIVRDQSSLGEIAKGEGCSERQAERILALAFLSPDLVKAAAEARLPVGVNSKALATAPPEWSQQWRMLGLPG